MPQSDVYDSDKVRILNNSKRKSKNNKVHYTGLPPSGIYQQLHFHRMGTIGVGSQPIAEHSKGEEDMGDDIEVINDGIPENKGEDSEEESEVEPPQDDELSQE